MKGSALGLFPAEQVFLDKVCDNVAQYFKMDNVALSIFKMKNNTEEPSCDEIYQKIMTKNPDGIDRDEYSKIAKLFVTTLGKESTNGEIVVESSLVSDIKFYAARAPHILSFFDCLNEDGSLCIDVCMYGGSLDEQSSMSLVTAISTALGIFRNGGSFASTTFIVNEDVVRLKQPEMMQFIAEAVNQWQKDDDDFQFWRKSSWKCMKGYFGEPNFRGMGFSLVDSIRESAQNYAARRGDKGNMKIIINAYDSLMKNAFGDLSGNSYCATTETTYGLNTDMRIIYGSGKRHEVDFLFEKSLAGAGDIIKISLVIESSSEIDLSEYRSLAMKEILGFFEVWRVLTGTTQYKFTTQKKITEF